VDLRPSFNSIAAAFGEKPEDASVTVPDGSPTQARIVWLSAQTVDYPAGTEYRRVEEHRAMAIPKDDVPQVPINTVIVCAETPGGGVRTWKVDSILQLDYDHTRVSVVPVETE